MKRRSAEEMGGEGDGKINEEAGGEHDVGGDLAGGDFGDEDGGNEQGADFPEAVNGSEAIEKNGGGDEPDGAPEAGDQARGMERVHVEFDQRRDAPGDEGAPVAGEGVIEVAAGDVEGAADVGDGVGVDAVAAGNRQGDDGDGVDEQGKAAI